MPKSLKIYIGILLLILIGIMVIDANRPKPINWRQTFSLNDKIPFGLYIFNEEYEKIFNPQKVTQFGESPYEFFDKHYDFVDYQYDIDGTFFYVSNNFEIDEESIDEIFYFASHGNDVFISCNDFPRQFEDSLAFKMQYDYEFQDTVSFAISGNEVKYDSFHKGINAMYFSEIDSTLTTIIGTQKSESGEIQANFIKVPFGNGNFYLHSQPIAFTNYYLLKDNYKYTEDVLSYFPKEKDVFWKIRRYQSENMIDSPLRFIFSQPALKWAWLFAIFGMVIFMFFNAKRRQRVIPIITPLRNTTVDFTKTIGNLYYQEKDYMNIIDKKIIFFLEKIRNDYYLDTFNLDETFINRLHQKSGKSKEEISELIHLIKKLRNQFTATENEVVELNSKIEKFYS